MKTNRLASGLAFVGLAGGVALALSCGGGGSPAAPPAVTPTPAATPIPSGAEYACKLGNGSATFDCDTATAKLYDHVVAAIDRLVKQRPQVFDLNDEAYPPGSGNYKVVDRDGYLDGVVTELGKAGLCAQRDPDDYNYERILVKADNSASEEYDIVTGAGYIRQNGAAYRATCWPATFPIPRAEDMPPAGSGCGRPYPVVTRILIKRHAVGNDVEVLDSTPLVGPDQAYCASVGFTDARSFCAVRHEGNPERVPCENWVMGNAADTGRPGPTWRNPRNEFCTGGDSGCTNHTNQYSVIVSKAGTYTACGRTGVCGSFAVQ